MTKWKLLAIFFALAISVSLIACGVQFVSNDTIQTPVVQAQAIEHRGIGTFVLVSQGSAFENSLIDYYVFYDPDTLVMYTYMTGAKSGGLTMMYNSDGTPKLYSPGSKTE